MDRRNQVAAGYRSVDPQAVDTGARWPRLIGLGATRRRASAKPAVRGGFRASSVGLALGRRGTSGDVRGDGAGRSPVWAPPASGAQGGRGRRGDGVRGGRGGRRRGAGSGVGHEPALEPRFGAVFGRRARVLRWDVGGRQGDGARERPGDGGSGNVRGTGARGTSGGRGPGEARGSGPGEAMGDGAGRSGPKCSGATFSRHLSTVGPGGIARDVARTPDSPRPSGSQPRPGPRNRRTGRSARRNFPICGDIRSGVNEKPAGSNRDSCCILNQHHRVNPCGPALPGARHVQRSRRP